MQRSLLQQRASAAMSDLSDKLVYAIKKYPTIILQKSKARSSFWFRFVAQP